MFKNAQGRPCRCVVFFPATKQVALIYFVFAPLKQAQIRGTACFGVARDGLGRRCGIHAANINPTPNVTWLIFQRSHTQHLRLKSGFSLFAFRLRGCFIG